MAKVKLKDVNDVETEFRVRNTMTTYIAVEQWKKTHNFDLDFGMNEMQKKLSNDKNVKLVNGQLDANSLGEGALLEMMIDVKNAQDKKLSEFFMLGKEPINQLLITILDCLESVDFCDRYEPIEIFKALAAFFPSLAWLVSGLQAQAEANVAV